MKTRFIILTLFLPILLTSKMALSQVNYDESKVPRLHLPSIFISEKGEVIDSKKDWENLRRPEIFNLFESEVYGQIPKDFDKVSFEVNERDDHEFNSIAKLEEVDIKIQRGEGSHVMRLNVFLPKEAKGPFPIILLINHRPAAEDGSLAEEGYWPVAELIERGFATASFHAEVVAPDDTTRYVNGILNNLYPEQMEQSDGLKALGAWGWGAIRAMDYFEQHEGINAEKSVLVGHSRSGKAALWASANDPRWAITYANESGCGGAALSKRKFGETVEIINNRFTHWFAENFRKYNGAEESLPLDQHMLPTLIAPRAVYYASAKADEWADPKGEYLSLQIGSEVFSRIYGQKSPFKTTWEELNGPVSSKTLGYHIREGEHGLTWEDWSIFLDFVEKGF
ncbi:alpha/beta hydrolase family protein [Algoriphagus sediminis]|uniref:Acetylxylan esterase n=1 Tax=Algoriphagus sediminis TaxID=3057113 RepID=A0ABT7YGK2_9BACT|nr:acetylxylan esterase [Algoriphagus sediminis]MDN3205603.1 acetylxylan esterase [Algoriphagus sediminis]